MPDFHLATERLIIRNWKDSDRDLMYEINTNDTIMEFFPFRRDRAESDALLNRLREGIARDGFGFTALELKETGEPIGFCGLADATVEDEVFAGSIEIGWRLALPFWGKGYVTEAAKRLLQYGFEEMNLPEIIAFAVHDNHRSTAVMQRIGMTHDPARDFAHPKVPDSHPHLKRHVTWAISRDRYQEQVFHRS